MLQLATAIASREFCAPGLTTGDIIATANESLNPTPTQLKRLSRVVPSLLFVHEHTRARLGACPIFLITKGELILSLGDREQRFGVGDWYTVPKGAEHATRFEVEIDEVAS
jgi:hypothetical protein